MDLASKLRVLLLQAITAFVREVWLIKVLPLISRTSDAALEKEDVPISTLPDLPVPAIR